MLSPNALYESPNALSSHYSRFRVAERLLLTGHSHQAWPDCGFEAHAQAWLDAAEAVDEKWDRAFARADRVRAGWARLLDDTTGQVTLGSNTHEMVVRFLSALHLRERPRLVTTDGEFHSIRRQLDRLAEEDIEIVKVPSSPPEALSEGIATAVDDRTAAALVSSVLFRSAHIVPGLDRALAACDRVGASLLVDAYHALNVVPVSLAAERLDSAFVVGGGYKYCQLGEGNCFLRVPSGCDLRPVITGWFSEFSLLREAAGEGVVAYGEGPDRFTGSTYDPTSHYRASAVFDFFERMELTPALLREVSQHQVTALAEGFDRIDADPRVITRDRSVPIEGLGGFLALGSPHAAALHAGLKARGVLTDYRDDILRLGPAPYLSDAQLADAIAALAETITCIERTPLDT
jgi:selenocysteine lyase/cysteine desulfurase